MKVKGATRRARVTRWALAAIIIGTLVAMVLSHALDEERPVADLVSSVGTVERVVLRGRLVEEDGDFDPLRSTPADALWQDDLSGVSFAVHLVRPPSGAAQEVIQGTTDAEGYFEVILVPRDLGLGPGRYPIRLMYRGAVAGEANALVLGADSRDVAVRSDVDLTYLDTDFSSRSAMLDLLRQDATERQTLPAMETVFQALRRGRGQGSGPPRPLTFLSGSPECFRRVLEARMRLDGVEQDGVLLKPFGQIITRNLADLDPSEIAPALAEQVGYKLAVLLQLRLELPPAAPEVLMGDDSEADVVVYVLYHRFTSGQLDTPGLQAELERLTVTPEWQAQVAMLAPLVLDHLGEHAPVRAIYINQTGRPSEAHVVTDWAEDGLVRYHRGAWPLVLDLFEEGWVSPSGVTAVADRLRELGQPDDDLIATAEAGVEAGFLSRATAARFARSR